VHLEPVNLKLLQQLKPEEVEVDVVRAEVVEELEETGVEADMQLTLVLSGISLCLWSPSG